MKRKLLVSFSLLISGILAFGQTTATDFTVNDCSGTSHHLFGELDAGKVVVIAFVDPCASCIAPSGTALGIVQSYASSNPGRVIYYLADDLANTSCSTLTSWGNTNGITGVPVFSTTAVSMNDYGSPAMPKIVVLAGPNHAVMFKQDNGLNSTNFTNAINQGLVAGITEMDNADMNLNVYPAPATEFINVNFNLKENNKVRFDIYNVVGEVVKSVDFDNTSAGNNKTKISVELLSSGIYFLKLTSGKSSDVIKFIVAK